MLDFGAISPVVWQLSTNGAERRWIWIVEEMENELLDGRERLDCVSCPKREAGTAEESADHQLHLDNQCLGGHHRSCGTEAMKLSSRQHVSANDSI